MGNLVMTQEINQGWDIQKLINHMRQQVNLLLKYQNIQPIKKVQAVLHYDISFVHQNIKINSTEGKRGVTKESLIKYKQSNNQQDLQGISYIYGFLLSFINNQYKSIPLCFNQQSELTLNQEDQLILQILIQELKENNINVVLLVHTAEVKQQKLNANDQIEKVIQKLNNRQNGVKLEKVFSGIKEPYNFNSCIQILKNIKNRNIFKKSTITVLNGGKCGTILDLMQIVKENQFHFHQSLKSESQDPKSDFLAIMSINQDAVKDIYEEYPIYGYYALLQIPLISQYLKQKRQEFWFSCKFSLYSFIYMYFDNEAYKENPEKQFLVVKDQIACLSQNDELSINQFKKLQKQEQKQYFMNLTFTKQQIEEIINNLIILIYLVEQNEELNLNCFYNNKIKEIFTNIRQIAKPEDNYQVVQETARKYLFEQYIQQYTQLNVNKDKIEDFKPQILKGDLDTRNLRVQEVRDLARQIYYLICKPKDEDIEQKNLVELMRQAFDLCGFF